MVHVLQKLVLSGVLKRVRIPLGTRQQHDRLHGATWDAI